MDRDEGIGRPSRVDRNEGIGRPSRVDRGDVLVEGIVIKFNAYS